MKRTILSLLLLPSLALAQFSGDEDFFEVASTSSRTSLTFDVSGNLEAGQLGIAVISFPDVASAADGDTSYLTSITDDQGNTWTKIAEKTNANTASAGDGVTTAVWYSVPTTTLTEAIDNITFTWSTTIAAVSIKGYVFNVGGGAGVSLDNSYTYSAYDSADVGSSSHTGLSSAEHLWFRAMGSSTGPTAITGTSGWTNDGVRTKAGATASTFEYKVASGTSSGASDPTVGTADWATVLFGFVEGAATPTPTPTPAGPTATPTPTPTATATPTPYRFSPYLVTNTNTSGTGSLADCAGAGGNACIITASGRLTLSDDIDVAANTIIDGRMAPEDGLMLTNAGLQIQGGNVIIKHVEIRPGDEASGRSFDFRRCLTVYSDSGADIDDVLVQNISCSWAIDQNITSGLNGNTVQNIVYKDNIFAEALSESYHTDGQHSSNVLVGQETGRTTLIGNLLASSRDRNPLLKRGSTVELINNYIYNYGPTQNSNVPRLEYAAGLPILLDMIGNLCVPGPNSGSNFSCLYGSPLDAGTSVYLSDNRGPTRTSDADPESDIANFTTNISGVRVVNATTTGIIDVDTVASSVLANAGFRPWNRVDVDSRILGNVQAESGNHYDCVVTSRCTTGDDQVPEGGFPARAVATAAITPDAADYSAAEFETWASQFETTPTPTPTPTAVPTNTPTPGPTATPGGYEMWFMGGRKRR